MITAVLRHSSSNISNSTTKSPSGITSWTYSDSANVSAPIDNAKFVRIASHTVTYTNSNLHMGKAR